MGCVRVRPGGHAGHLRTFVRERTKTTSKNNKTATSPARPDICPECPRSPPCQPYGDLTPVWHCRYLLSSASRAALVRVLVDVPVVEGASCYRVSVLQTDGRPEFSLNFPCDLWQTRSSGELSRRIREAPEKIGSAFCGKSAGWCGT